MTYLTILYLTSVVIIQHLYIAIQDIFYLSNP